MEDEYFTKQILTYMGNKRKFLNKIDEIITHVKTKLGEKNIDRVKLIQVLANLDVHPESVPINRLVKVEGTPYFDNVDVDEFDFIKVIALARIAMPKSYVRLSAGRDTMNDHMQAMCFLAGANSIFYGEELLTTKNSTIKHDQDLLKKLKIKTMSVSNQYNDSQDIDIIDKKLEDINISIKNI